jgi:hypothetical protein
MTTTDPLLKNSFVQITNQNDVIIVDILPSDFPDADFDEYIAFLTDYWTRKTPSCFIIDISKGKYMSSDKRIKFGNVTKKYKEEMKKSVHCVAFVNTSILASTVLKGILMVSPLEVPTKVFTKLDDAKAWCDTFMKK